MQIDVDDLRRHYESLTDDELLEIERSELTDQARGCYDYELKRRGLTAQPSLAEEETEGESDAEDADVETDPGWLDTAACACSYFSPNGGTAASDADIARAALDSAGIPCEVTVAEVAQEPPDPHPPKQYEYRVMVPGPLNLKATSILDKEIFNPDMEDGWRNHFEALSDDDLRALTPEVICAGLADRIARLKRVYQEEVERRKLAR